ncbi:MAG: bifunctional phosphopantothenoylcysteine decarboxylase/phosphopantothenate--cysteine ligase CoaBC, partial [Candidatus Omnitrophica bacterium]|nr:bifunctional phosphopantothenoylcysteine decarboxylase/phosphopantothenate--cysteine ligase CoaBC [Candidatus Omnitrophota bacterium]
MNLKNKRVLITSGPTQVAIDSVRVITNNATAETGILLANKLKDSGAKVTLLLGLVNNCVLKKNIRVLNVRFFDELKRLIENELKVREYDLVIHSAAVSDYQPLNIYKQKIRS